MFIMHHYRYLVRFIAGTNISPTGPKCMKMQGVVTRECEGFAQCGQPLYQNERQRMAVHVERCKAVQDIQNDRVPINSIVAN